MTEDKRFGVIPNWCVYEKIDEVEKYLTFDETVTILNQLNDENEQLKARIQYLERKIQRERNSHIKQHEKWEEEIQKENEQLKQFKEKVFVLLDEKIKHYEHKPISAPVGQPMSVNFDADVDRLARLSELQDLEKELKMND